MNTKVIHHRLHSISLSWKALWHYNIGNTNAAILLLEESLNLDPTNGPNLQTLGIMLVKDGRYEDGLFYLERALKNYPEKDNSRPEIIAYIAFAQFNLGRIDESLENYQYAVDIWRKNGDFKLIDLLYAIGRIYLQKNEYIKAIDFFLQGIKLDDKDANIHFGLGISYFEIGENEESLYHLEKAIELDPSLRNDSTLNKIKKELGMSIRIH